MVYDPENTVERDNGEFVITDFVPDDVDTNREGARRERRREAENNYHAAVQAGPSWNSVNGRRFFTHQRRAVDMTFGERAHSRNPAGSREAHESFNRPVAEDGERLPDEESMGVGGWEPLISEDQRNAARARVRESASRARSSLSTAVETAANNPVIAGGAALILVLAVIL